MQKTVLVFSEKSEVFTWCEEFLPSGISRVDLRNVFELQKSSSEIPKFHGAIIDLDLRLRASADEHAFIRAIEDIYPVVFISSGVMDTPILWMDGASGDILQSFLDKLNVSPKRALRRSRRANLALNFELSTSKDFAASTTERVASLNVSESGMFVFSVSGALHSGQKIYLRPCSFIDQTPISAEIQWVRNWGEYDDIPGIGLTFDKMTSAQSTELSAKLADNWVVIQNDEADI